MSMAADGAEQSVKVLNTCISGFGMRVLIALHEKGVQFDYHEEDLALKSQLLLHSNPIHQKIPVLLHNAKPICESLVIVQYIDEAWPSADKLSFLPADPYRRALARFWADYVDKKVYDAGARVIGSPEGAQREQAKEDMKECLVTLDVALCDMCGGGPYVGGERIGLVDIAFAPFLCWLEAYETVLDEGECPHLAMWAKVVVEYPSVKKALSMAPPHKVVEFAHALRKSILGA